MRNSPPAKDRRGRILRTTLVAAIVSLAALALSLAPLLRERRLAVLPLPELERRATDPSASPRLDYYLGEAQRRAGKIPAALVTLGRAMQRDPEYLPAYVAFARALLAAGRPREAADVAARVLRADRTDRDAAIVYANALLDEGRPEEAAAQALNVTKLYPDNAEAWFVAGYAQAQANQRSSAEASLRQALQLDDRMADAHRVLGDVLLAGSRREEARTHLDRALALAPDDPLVHLVLARWYLTRGTTADRAEARRHLEHPMGLHPPLAYYLARGELARDEKQWAAAIEFLRRAAAMAPHDARVFFQLSQAYRGAGREAEADRAFQTYLGLTRATGQPPPPSGANTRGGR